MSTPDNLTARIDGLCDVLTAAGSLSDPTWRQALHAVPRHLFVPVRAWAAPNGEGDGYIIDRDADPETWWAAVYSDAAIITQRNDGATEPTEGGEPSSSCSAPATVAEFLECLAPEDHNRVLEVGTGTGWTAALLSHRAGADNVTSIDIDEAVSEVAGKNLAGAGVHPHLIVGDGTVGFPEGAPFDRVHVAVGVADIPYTWIEQTRPGGVIVLPWMPGYGFGWLTRLHVLNDGTAIARFPGLAGYMMLRSQRYGYGTPGERADDYTETTTRLDPRRLDGDSCAADLAISVMVPGAQTRLFYGDGDEADECTLWVLERDGGEGSWASVDYIPGGVEFVVQQHGPRRLWDEVEAAYWRWMRLGRPGLDRFGLTVGPDGQRVWLDSPGNVITP